MSLNTASAADAMILDALIRPALFRDSVGPPSLTLLVGQPGSGSRGVTTVVGRQTGGVAFHVDELAGFLPGFWDAGQRHPLEARDLLASRLENLADKLVATAFDESQPVALGDSLLDVDTASTLVSAAADRGYSTRMIAVAARRSESLLTAISAYMQGRRRGIPVMFTSRHEHQRGWELTESLVRWAATADALQRLTVVDRRGSTLFDARRGDKDLDPAVAALDDARHAPWTVATAMAWFGELRRVTEYARSERELSAPVAEVLLELQSLGLREVLPDLPLRPAAPVVAEQERRIASEIVQLRQVLAETAAVEVEQPVVVAAPDVTPVEPETSGPSL